MTAEKDGSGRSEPFASLGRFKPKPEAASGAVLAVDIDKLASDNCFPSREAHPAKAQKRRRFGEVEAPTEQLNFRAKVLDKERFYELAEKHGYRKLGDLFEKMLDAFEDVKRNN